MKIPNFRELGLPGLLAAAAVAGFVLLPAIVYLIGSSVLGRYEGASLGTQYGSIYRGLGHGNIVSWMVVLGPLLLILLARALKPLWYIGQRPTD